MRGRRIITGAVVAGIAAVLAAVLAATLATAAPAPSAGARPATARAHPNVLFAYGPAPVRSTSARPHLQFIGGHVIAHPKVYLVLWGGGTYASQISRSAAPSVPDMIKKLTSSSYFDLLSEYSTGRETIGRGSYAGIIRLKPRGVHNRRYIDDQRDIQPELKYQVSIHRLPKPDANTLFMIHFPRNKVITLGGFDSRNAFCGYHYFVPHVPYHLRYAVLPDVPSSACRAFAPRRISNLSMMTVVDSHELIEATTDPEVHTWEDPVYGEVGDICSFKFPPARASGYAVEMAWSNQQRKCATSGSRRLVSVGNASVMETNSGYRVLRVPVTLSAASHLSVTMKYTLQNGSAKGAAHAGSGADFGNRGGTVKFTVASGQTHTVMTKFISVPVYADTIDESDETLAVRLSSLSPGYGFGRYRGIVTIHDDDPTGAPGSFGVGDVAVRKSDTGQLTVPFFVTLSDPQSVPVTVDYSIDGVSATRGVDFTGPTTGTLTFAPGQMAARLSVRAISHTNTDARLTLTLSNPAGAGGLVIGRPVGTATLAHAH